MGSNLPCKLCKNYIALKMQCKVREVTQRGRNDNLIKFRSEKGSSVSYILFQARGEGKNGAYGPAKDVESLL